MNKQRLTLPKATKEILESSRHRYDCPRCSSGTHTDGFVSDSVTRQWELPPAITWCSFCTTGGGISFTDVVASEASPTYIRLLFRLIRSEIKAGTDDAYKRAQMLIFLTFDARNIAVEKTLVDQPHLTSEQTLHEVVQLFTRLSKCRKQAYDEDMAEACQATQAKLEEKVKAIAADAGLRRRTLDAQKDIEERFGQRY